MRRRCFSARIALLVLYVLFAAGGSAVAREYALKAAFLFNFCQFVEWPGTAFPTPNSPLIIGVIGADPFGGTLAETIEGEVIRGRPIRMERYRRPEDARNCHVLFIAESERHRIPTILSPLRGTNVLTVGESETFLRLGGMIALIADQNRVRLQINPTVAKSAHLDLSSKLLRVAKIYP